uniref:Uncharacterized protein n=1 Tax=Arundo donax TaxID=35708 RepID=A0A0A9BQB9_ARUDO
MPAQCSHVYAHHACLLCEWEDT